MPDAETPEVPWRVLATSNREYLMPFERPTAFLWHSIKCLNDNGEMEIMFQQHNDPHPGAICRAKYLTVIDHPRNDEEAVELIRKAKESP